MKELRRLAIVVPAVMLTVVLLLLYMTRGTMEQLAFLRRGLTVTGLVDQLPYQTAETLAGMASSAEEQTLAQEAVRLSDHGVDQAFAMALRQASLAQRVLSGDAAKLAERMQTLKAMIRDDQARVDQLTDVAKTSGIVAAEGDELDVAKAQLGLDSDELVDASEDLARESGDLRGRIQQELAAREAALKKDESSAAPKKDMAVTAVQRHATLSDRLTAWFEQRNRAALVRQAHDKAMDDIRDLTTQHARLEQQTGNSGNSIVAQAGTQRVKLLDAMAARRVLMSILDDRMQTEQQLAETYTQWEAQVWLQHRILGHLVLQSLAWVMGLVLVTLVGVTFARAIVRRAMKDHREAKTLQTVVSLALETVGLITVLLVIFGMPEHTPTILGLATAGLTVVFQDFILAFFGWFVLMGRNGIRVSDWVEINSVGGEVAEIGLFRTTLLETGNWNSPGHPTGRRVRFMNGFAIRGQFFNFSTHGQWMWDEIRLNVPATTDAYELIKRMQQAVERETAQDTEQAEREWQQATREVGLSQFSAKPTVDLRPAASGVDVLVRYVTRASDRFGLRKRIYEGLVELMGGRKRPSLGEEKAEE